MLVNCWCEVYTNQPTNQPTTTVAVGSFYHILSPCIIYALLCGRYWWFPVETGRKGRLTSEMAPTTVNVKETKWKQPDNVKTELFLQQQTVSAQAPTLPQILLYSAFSSLFFYFSFHILSIWCCIVYVLNCTYSISPVKWT